jgi:hypothetical protein
MSVIIIACAHCRADIDTGINVDWVTFAQLPEIHSEMVCPSCGVKGFWDKSRARLDDVAAARSVA